MKRVYGPYKKSTDHMKSTTNRKESTDAGVNNKADISKFSRRGPLTTRLMKEGPEDAGR